MKLFCRQRNKYLSFAYILLGKQIRTKYVSIQKSKKFRMLTDFVVIFFSKPEVHKTSKKVCCAQIEKVNVE